LQNQSSAFLYFWQQIQPVKILSKALLFCFLLLLSRQSYSQLTAISQHGGIGKLWMQFGYNRAYFLPGDIKFQGKDYAFTLNKAQAYDDWQFASLDKWDKQMPQFTYRLGYFFNSEEMWGFELSYTWVNYVLQDNSKVKVKGNVEGENINGDAYLTEDFLRYKLSNGSGYAEAKVVKGFLIYGNHDYSQMFFALAKAGGGLAVTRTKATLFGITQQNDFAVSGFTGTLEGTAKYTYKSHWNFETGIKGDFVDYTNNATVHTGKATNWIVSLHWITSIGFEVRL
jgi:hypothetical protein